MRMSRQVGREWTASRESNATLVQCGRRNDHLKHGSRGILHNRYWREEGVWEYFCVRSLFVPASVVFGMKLLGNIMKELRLPATRMRWCQPSPLLLLRYPVAQHLLRRQWCLSTQHHGATTRRIIGLVRFYFGWRRVHWLIYWCFANGFHGVPA